MNDPELETMRKETKDLVDGLMYSFCILSTSKADGKLIKNHGMNGAAAVYIIRSFELISQLAIIEGIVEPESIIARHQEIVDVWHRILRNQLPDITKAKR